MYIEQINPLIQRDRKGKRTEQDLQERTALSKTQAPYFVKKALGPVEVSIKQVIEGKEYYDKQLRKKFK
ncbi:hypothetical protein [Holospora curviuscula]|uniref:Uncharacterized protein n=1 Tax=Holospora curviuscula TaxID=1082868 RepID=A0A2S5RAH5_9PROT|nr:hypothetical protein [Holospora curviuscula]PPE04303.1 hypothetical protein HCUR_00360 [Holospora curviuscula]